MNFSFIVGTQNVNIVLSKLAKNLYPHGSCSDITESILVLGAVEACGSLREYRSSIGWLHLSCFDS